ncbi:Serine/threonine-protein_phosphatase 2C [Hexamita inflata]|uniref:Serine/threonine-protein phosphatase 2C n=2 Tax=Hexamita inflata TaxID=28002 RepID=A0AA86UXT8_9EUKA|nr:Serine/threonine-protein phosphatase 2C [Hexamita inflata]
MEQLVAFASLLVVTSGVSWVLFQCLLSRPNNGPFSFQKLNKKVSVQFGHHGLQGQRPTMEDAVIYDRSENLFIMGVCDGHNGDRAAQFSARHFSSELLEQLKTDEIVNALKQSIFKLDQRFLQMAKALGYRDGSTLCAVVIEEDQMWAVNLGDSRAIVYENGRLVELTQDHKPSVDKDIIEAAGGFVHPLMVKTKAHVIFSGPDRIYPGGLSLSRGIGDIMFKDAEYLTSVGVSHPLIQSEPDISHISTKNCQLAVIACDGLYDVFSSLEVIQMAVVLLSILFGPNQKKHDILLALQISQQNQRFLNNAQIISQILSRIAIENGSTDNVSVCCIVFQNMWKPSLWALSSENVTVETYEEFIASKYDQQMFEKILQQYVEELSFTGGDKVGALELKSYYQVFKKYFYQEDYETDFQMIEASEKDINLITKQRNQLWIQYENEGKVLSDLRTTIEETGIQEAAEDFDYEIIG